MNASKLVERLKTYQSLTSLLGKDPGGEPAIYQILASQPSVWPRLEVFEENRRWTRFVDDEPAQETIRFRQGTVPAPPGCRNLEGDGAGRLSARLGRGGRLLD